MTSRAKVIVGAGVLGGAAAVWWFTRSKKKPRAIVGSVEVIDSPYSEADGVCWSFADGEGKIVDMALCQGRVSDVPGAGVIATASEYWERTKAALRL
jgi:hypothetical protein